MRAVALMRRPFLSSASIDGDKMPPLQFREIVVPEYPSFVDERFTACRLIMYKWYWWGVHKLQCLHYPSHRHVISTVPSYVEEFRFQPIIISQNPPTSPFWIIFPVTGMPVTMIPTEYFSHDILFWLWKSKGLNHLFVSRDRHNVVSL